MTPARTLLRPLSVPYSAFVRLRAWSYRKGIMRSRRLPGIVISVGNLTVGGTGKTPFVIWLTTNLLEAGKHVAVLSRGYRGAFRGALRGGEPIKSRGSKQAIAALSDETRVLMSSLGNHANSPTHLAFGIGPNRFTAGSELASTGHEWFVLDDGFQHLELARDLDIVLIDATNPFGGGHLLPAGGLREPRSALRRADIVVITRSTHAPAVEAIIERHSDAPIFYATMKFEGLATFTASSEAASFVELARNNLFAFAAIGNPSAFFENLREWGVPIVGQASFPDHHKFSRADVKRLEDLAQAVDADAFVCTKKDIFNLDEALPLSLPVWTCNASLEVHDADDFWQAAREILKRRKPEIVN